MKTPNFLLDKKMRAIDLRQELANIPIFADQTHQLFINIKYYIYRRKIKSQIHFLIFSKVNFNLSYS